MERIPNEMSKVKVYSVKVYLCAATDLELLVAPLQEGLQGSLLHRLRRLRSPVYRPEQQFRFLPVGLLWSTHQKVAKNGLNVFLHGL